MISHARRFPNHSNLGVILRFLVLLSIGLPLACTSAQEKQPSLQLQQLQADTLLQTRPQPAAVAIQRYLPMLQGKNVAMVVNQTSRVGEVHLVDTLLALGINIQKIFAPEHGFRGTADAGETVKDATDMRTGLPIISLYGKNKKPTASQLAGIDLVVFDIQDVGARFYTYISTMHYVMEACAEQKVALIVLDRPNPNGHYIDGPVLDTAYRSFVGMHPIPVVHGLTVGELSQMINGEGWLAGGLQCSITVIMCDNYTHSTPYQVPVAPSPNLPNAQAIALYPSLCFFEPTIVSIGRGTEAPFQLVGSPEHAAQYAFSFTPQSTSGAKYPKHEGVACFGEDFRQMDVQSLDSLWLGPLLRYYQQTPQNVDFFTNTQFFDLLAGSPALRTAIMEGQSAEEIRQSWQPALATYKALRQRYLLYEE